jgi:flagellar biogenesis protein FliO
MSSVEPGAAASGQPMPTRWTMDGRCQLSPLASRETFFRQSATLICLSVAVILLCASLSARAETPASTEPAKNETKLSALQQIAGPLLSDAHEKLAATSDPVAAPAADTDATPKPVASADKTTSPSSTKAPPPSIEQTFIRKPTDTKPAAAPSDTSAPSSASTTMLPSGVTQSLQVGAALAIVIGLIFIGKAAARKYLPQAKTANGKNVIEILARHPLCKNQSLVLVRIGSQIVTLNQGKDSSQSVLVISDPTEVAKILGQIDGQNPNSIQAGFNKLLANARMDLEDPANDPDRDDFELRSMEPENLDTQLEEMAAAKRQLMELRQQVRSVRDNLTRD